MNISPPKTEIFSDKNSDIFRISTQNIDCRYLLEPPGQCGSNEYLKTMFWAEIKKKNNVYPCKPQFYYTKVGFKGVKITVDSRYLEFQGTHWNTSRYQYFDISELREWGKQQIDQPHLTNEYLIWLLKLEIYIYIYMWERGEIAHEEQFLLFSTLFCYLLS